jgi:hypothetical protein
MMKKALILVLSLLFTLSFVSMSYAAVTMGGNLRVWYQSTKDENGAVDNITESANGFRFDRLAVSLVSDLSDVDGIKGEVQFRTIRASDKTSDSGFLRVNSAYYYRKTLFMSSDEFDAGVIDQLPFKSSGYNAVLLESFANNLVKNSNSVGIKYASKISSFDFALAIVNSNNQAIVNTASTNEGDGLDYGLRFNYAPVSNFKVGCGYIDDYTNKENDKKAYVVDINGSLGAFGGYVEYVSVTPKDQDNGTGIYGEVSYKVATPLSFYIGRAVKTSDANIYSSSYLGGFDFYDAAGNATSYKYPVADNWSLLGVKYQLTPKAALQGEYIVINTDNDAAKNIVAVRLKVDF